ncbi:DUF294 nucleotidyltransferase-like domain-containing protein [Caldalkalibacillus salinus]|uniref:DUF294 nucleotidyltransferase-like domain-containing protein n=1 Tax=Caldalkalibacillus salinus TaxID=2803787 RepID=UPI001923C7FD|nr:DUF294 nucleotidyltransferase-like domain-containing protein [Caldalkalibacillus salinus]
MVRFQTYEDIKQYRNENMMNHRLSSTQLNHFHDELMQHVISLAVARTKIQLGEPPGSFSFFVMGSAGRREQGLISDQDHGMVYEENTEEAKQYFQKLGEHISHGLAYVGYPLCEGRVMCSNPLWCQSASDWQDQLHSWIKADTWEAIRHLLILTDSRVLVGSPSLVYKLKEILFEQVNDSPYLLNRFAANTASIQKGVGVFGHFLTEQYGYFKGYLNLKSCALLPYVNAARLFALKDNLWATSTSERLSMLERQPSFNSPRHHTYEKNVETLLAFRLTHAPRAFFTTQREQQNRYEASHYMCIKSLSRSEKKQLKSMIKQGLYLQERLTDETYDYQ